MIWTEQIGPSRNSMLFFRMLPFLYEDPSPVPQNVRSGPSENSGGFSAVSMSEKIGCVVGKGCFLLSVNINDKENPVLRAIL